MKKLALCLIICFCSAALIQAQSRIGGGFAYGTDVEEFGLNLNGEFFLKSKLAIAPELNIFFVEGDNGFWTINADGHFYFAGSGAASVYGLAGLNLSTVTFERANGEDDSDTELGLNFGIGANFDINSSIMPFGQFKFVLNDYDQAVLSFGIRFTLN